MCKSLYIFSFLFFNESKLEIVAAAAADCIDHLHCRVWWAQLLCIYI